VRSSISSSDPWQRAPALPWLRVWVTALALTALAIAGLETLGRSAGLTPNVEDSPRLWAHVRDAASSHGGPIVLLGSSRVQVGIDPEILAPTVGRPVLQLALNGASPLPFLHDLARDPSFRGSVVCGVPPAAVFGDRAGWDERARQQLAFRGNRAWIERFETPARLWMQQRTVLTLPQMAPARLVRTLASGELPAPGAVMMKRSRFEAMDYQAMRARGLGHGRGDESPLVRKAPPDVVRQRLQVVADDVASIRERGGELWFVRMPTTADVAGGEDETFGADAMARLADVTKALVLDARAEPTMARFDCGDGVHLDVRDARLFTAELGRWLVDHGLEPDSDRAQY